MKSEEVGDNVTDFGEAKARLELNRQRGIFIRNGKMVRNLSIFLYGVNDYMEKGEIDLNEEQKLTLGRLLPEFMELIRSTTTRVVRVSRKDIDIIGSLAVSVKNTQSRKNKSNLYKALLGLDEHFIKVGGIESLEFKKQIKSILDQK